MLCYPWDPEGVDSPLWLEIIQVGEGVGSLTILSASVDYGVSHDITCKISLIIFKENAYLKCENRTGYRG